MEEHTRHVARGLQERGVRVEIWTPDRGERLGMQEVDGIRVRYLPTPLPARKLSSLSSLVVQAPATGTAWFEAWRAFRPDLLHVQCFGPNGTYALGLALLSRRSLVLSSHGETFMDDHDIFERSALQRRALAMACGRAEVVTGCSTMVAQDLQQRFGAGEVQVVPNGVVLDPVASSRPATQEEQVVLAAGRVVEKKGFDLLIRAAQAFPPHARVQIVGEGPGQKGLEKLATELGIRSRIDFLGRKDAGEVQRLMAKADVVVVPSRVEAFGIVVLEAWASGTPLVATTRGGPADLVTDGVDGRLVDPEDTTALARAVVQLLSDREKSRRMATRGLETVRRFTWDRVVDAYMQIYGSVQSGR
ncbi:glycosyltransferase family 4 protein [Ornithinimicrobium avium]|uniref:glycosyltransferase family 4 protein n=1 Tax=Ornithinimicrobium avium TaxID=2283195 RepID=UPI001D18D387|nr:glycosyltransferase family 4 protein [Ornithinimicrobium avium]